MLQKQMKRSLEKSVTKVLAYIFFAKSTMETILFGIVSLPTGQHAYQISFKSEQGLPQSPNVPKDPTTLGANKTVHKPRYTLLSAVISIADENIRTL